MYRRAECEFYRRKVRLTPLEADIVSTLLLNRGRPLIADDIVEAIYHPDLEPETAHNCILVVISRIRSKLPGLIRHHGKSCGRGFTGWVVDLPFEERLAA